MQLTQRYRYAIFFNTLYRFKQARWKAYLLDVAAAKDHDIGHYAEAISFKVEDVSWISPKSAEELLNNEESKPVDIKEIGNLSK